MKTADEDSEEFLVMITDHQIIEKNIRGEITEMLDLSALIQLESKAIVSKTVVAAVSVISVIIVIAIFLLLLL